MSTTTSIVLALFLLMGNAFFVAAEFALVSARRTQIEPRAEEGSRDAMPERRRVWHWALHRRRVLQLGLHRSVRGVQCEGSRWYVQPSDG